MGGDAERFINVLRIQVLAQKSPAEFFAENQIIAGFDNPGQSSPVARLGLSQLPIARKASHFTPQSVNWWRTRWMPRSLSVNFQGSS